MKKLTFILSLSLCFWLVSCDQSSNMSHETESSKHGHSSMPMQHLTMLLEHGISMMAQGAELKLEGDAHGDVMLKQSADVLRRAMSGPEMAAMHKGGQGQSAMMQHTHALGAAAFDMLDLMMSLQVSNAPANHVRLHHALNMAAQGANLQSLAGMGMSQEIDAFMQAQGTQMQQTSMILSEETTAHSDYHAALLKLIHLLMQKSKSNMQHAH